MIKNVDPALPPRVLSVLWAMGHGDEIAVVDKHVIANWNETTEIQGDLVKMDEMDSLQAVHAILSALQLDTTFVDHPVLRLESDRPDLLPDAHREVQRELDEALGFPCAIQGLAYSEFYEMARTCYALIVTNGTRTRGSFILRKGLDVTPSTV
jgi:L-fucose mutarotase